MGFRLPLDSLPWSTPEDLAGRSSSAIRSRRAAPLPRATHARAAAAAGQRRRRSDASRAVALAARRRARSSARRSASSRATARCTSSCRRSALLEDYLDLVATIEDERRRARAAGAHRGLRSRRAIRACSSCQVTPDPASSRSTSTRRARGASSVANTDRALRGGARRSASAPRSSCSTAATPAPAAATTSSSAAPTPADSPLLRRPDLLRSLIAYWHQPSVAVVPVLGPVRRPDQPGAAPRRGAPGQPVRAGDRVRRARANTTGARAAVAGRSAVPPPARRRDRQHAPHRVLHRQAVQPRLAPAGRQGLLELRALRDAARRAHELRAAAAGARAASPGSGASRTTRPLVRWGTALHDRFMLPHFVWQDFARRHRRARPRRLPARRRLVRAALRVPLPAPRRASPSSGVELELRQAIEPWHVLGEEPGGGGTARYVDSSVERAAGEGARHDRRAPRRHLQRPPRAAAPDRHAPASSSPACATGRGSRRRRCTRRSPSHAPLVFDLRRHLGRSLARRLHLLTWPIRAGSRYETFPRNALEAESRRAARFFPFGHTPGHAAAAARRRAARSSRSRSTCAGR